MDAQGACSISLWDPSQSGDVEQNPLEQGSVVRHKWEVEVTWGVRSGGLSYQGLKAISLLRQNLVYLDSHTHYKRLTARVKTTLKTL